MMNRRQFVGAGLLARSLFATGALGFAGRAAETRNAHDIVNAASPGPIRSQFKFIYHRGQCELVPGPGYNSIKDLKSVWEAFPQYNASNTWAIDDTQSKYRRQPENLILLKEFKGGDYCDRELIRLQEVLSHLFVNYSP